MYLVVFADLHTTGDQLPMQNQFTTRGGLGALKTILIAVLLNTYWGKILPWGFPKGLIQIFKKAEVSFLALLW